MTITPKMLWAILGAIALPYLGWVSNSIIQHEHRIAEIYGYLAGISGKLPQ